MLQVDGTEVQKVVFNGTPVNKVIFNGTVVFESHKEKAVLISPRGGEIKIFVKTSEGRACSAWQNGVQIKTLPSGKYSTFAVEANQPITLKGTNTTQLLCQGNNLTSLDAQGLDKLEFINCKNNRLTSLNVRGLARLRILDCQFNQLKSLDVQGLTELQTLNCRFNQITSLDVRGLTKLQTLNCYNNRLTSLNIQGLTTPLSLNCGYNRLSDLDIQGVFRLKYLNLVRNYITKASFISLFNALPTAFGVRQIVLYQEYGSNFNDFTSSPDIASAFQTAKDKDWKLYKNFTHYSNLL